VIGRTLGPYEIVAQLGAGGMGEVYRARDTQLNRDVAIKVVRTTLTDDPDRRARFSREAHILASLNQPNIAHVYSLETTPEGRQAIVMELVDGPTLADRLTHGPLPLEEALPIMGQIVLALEAAHEQGIIHRDLKPANIKVRPDGVVKVLDFGLAKALDANVSGATAGERSNSPTMTNRATEIGTILGTAAYMAPEQARGKAVDKRVDIWAFGVVMYEVLTGRRAFDGEDVSETLASVLTRDVDWSHLPASVPPGIRALIADCLVRDPKRRLRDIGDARLALTRTSTDTPLPTSSPTSRGQRLPWMLAGLFAVAMVVLAGWLFSSGASPSTDTPGRRLDVVLPGIPGPVVVSPDGQWLVYRPATSAVAAKVRRLDSPSDEWRELSGTAGGVLFFWAADSRRVGFAQRNALKTVDLVGSRPQTLCTACVGDFRGATWNAGGSIVFSDTRNPLRRVSAAGGEIAPVTEMDATRQETEHLYPSFLPDGRRFLFVARSNTGDHSIMLGSLDGGRPKRIASGYTTVAFASGHLLFSRDGALVALPFDANSGEVSGDPVVIETSVRTASGGVAYFSVSTEGTLVSTPESAPNYWWVDRGGTRIQQVQLPPPSGSARVLADGSRIVVSLVDADLGSRDIYVANRRGGGRSRLTFDPEWDMNPLWSPNGAEVLFQSQRLLPKIGLYVRTADGAGPERLLVARESQLQATDWSPDGRHVLINDRTTGKTRDILSLTMPDGSRLEPWRATEFDEADARFSPDGEWVAYESNQNGSLQVYVGSFANSAVAHRATTAGGRRPVWSRDGQELYYRDPRGQLMMVPIRTTPTLSVGAAQEVFPASSDLELGALGYEVDDQGRFLLGLIDRTSAADTASIVLNWPKLVSR
jgi:serine/threonine protein kinase